MSKKSAQTPCYYSEDAVYYASACAPMRRAAADGRVELRAFTHGHYFGESLPDDLLPGLCTVGYWNARTEQNWTLDWHRNEGVELNFQASGSGAISMSGREILLKPGDMTITRPWALHRFGVPNVRRGVRVWAMIDLQISAPNSPWVWPSWIVLTDADKKRVESIALNGDESALSLSKKRVEPWKELLKELKKESARPNFSRVAILLNEIFYVILEANDAGDAFHPSEESLTRRIVQDFLLDFEARPSSLRHRWTVPQMARKCGMSPANFFLRFHELTNASPNQYLNAVRIKKATELLAADATRSIASLAEEVGFASSQYFATVFKKLVGQTPSEYVARLKKDD